MVAMVTVWLYCETSEIEGVPLYVRWLDQWGAVEESGLLTGQ